VYALHITVFAITRKGVQTVTISTTVPNLIPILVLAAKGEVPDGIANFYLITDDKGHSSRSDDRPIRCLTDKDLKEASRVLDANEKRLLSGALDLRQGFQTNDALLREQGFEKIGAGAPQIMAQNPLWASLRYPVVVTEQLKDVRLVMWFSSRNNQFTPALFCPNVHVGLFLKSLMEIRSCPYCGTLFLPGKNNIIYCSIPHREAYRTGRSRWRKKQNQESSVKNGVKRGKKKGSL
jgi:hypothetical protein